MCVVFYIFPERAILIIIFTKNDSTLNKCTQKVITIPIFKVTE